MGIYLYFELIAFIFSLITFFKKKDTLSLYFIPFLFCTVLVELIGVLLSRPYKYPLYNIFTTLEFCFYSIVFNIYLKRKLLKKFSIRLIPIIVLFSLINILFLQGFAITFNTYTFLVGSFFMVLLCCFYFYESVQADSIDLQLSRQPFFWVSSGLLIFYLGSVIINALFEYLVSNGLKSESAEIYKIINQSLNVILYSSFCIAFYLCPNNRKISSSPSS